MSAGHHIIVGVTGGIAAYKSALLVRELVKAGDEVQVVMTRSAAQFITPLTMSTLSRRAAITDMFPHAGDVATEQWTRHIELGVWADAMVIAPATANTIAKIAHGFADNFLTTLVLALRGPLIVAPAMDVDMWLNETTQRNVAALRESGCVIIEPETGELASGLSGPGRLPEPDVILRSLREILAGIHHDLRGKHVLVTAGPTYEPIDPVRFIGNRSSGKMGFALAAAAAQRGGDVTLISGPVALRTPRNTRRVDVATAAEMQAAVEREFPAADLVIMAAAVGDFAPVSPSQSKLKREQLDGDRLTLEFTKNPDILKSIGQRKRHQVLVGFALETDDELANARNKLAAKNLDAVVLNNPTVPGAGFGTDTNVVTVLTARGEAESLPLQPKTTVAHEILNRIIPLLH
ncbi:MAG: phosphopantothenoylcysteine decarboxylase [Bacteroidetes bacterium]|nr:phosphopantothenoylcysteine decarboxylase [Bacteroidota bacterium]